MSLQYECPKCNHTNYSIEEIRTTGGIFSKLFNVQNKKFTTVTCSQCRYTELYKTNSSALGNVFDFFMD